MLMSELARLQPSEIIAPSVAQKVLPFQIVPEEKIDLPEEILANYNCSKVPASVFESHFALNNLKTVFKTKSLDAFGLKITKSDSKLQVRLWPTFGRR